MTEKFKVGDMVRLTEEARNRRRKLGAIRFGWSTLDDGGIGIVAAFRIENEGGPQPRVSILETDGKALKWMPQHLEKV